MVLKFGNIVGALTDCIKYQYLSRMGWKMENFPFLGIKENIIMHTEKDNAILMQLC